MLKRRWISWPQRAVDELNSISGVVGAGGMMLGGAGLLLATPIITAGGGLIALGATCYAIVRGVPAKLNAPEEMVGHRLNSLSDLDQLTRRIPRVGIVGSSSTGKSTLVEKLLRSAEVPDPTASVYIVIMRSGGENPKLFALIDGAGEEYPQQFSVAEAADVLFIVFDHNSNANEASVRQARLADHTNFSRQLVAFLRGKKFARRIYVLLNKHDSWRRSANAEDFKDWGESVKSDLTDVIEGSKITVREHSNWEVDYINKFWNEIEAAIK